MTTFAICLNLIVWGSLGVVAWETTFGEIVRHDNLRTRVQG